MTDSQNRKAVVLLSGGQDSTTCLYWAKKNFDEVSAVSVNYGQRHVVELQRAAHIAMAAKVWHIELELLALKAIGASDLVKRETVIKAEGGFVDREMPQGLPTSFVPGRNILFLSLVASYAAKVGARHIVTGVCQTDYSGYPDCREEFVKAMNKALNLGLPSSCSVEIHTPLMHLTKKQTVELAVELGPECLLALGRSVTCYNGQVPGCGKCPACELRAKGFAEAGLLDPQFALTE